MNEDKKRPDSAPILIAVAFLLAFAFISGLIMREDTLTRLLLGTVWLFAGASWAFSYQRKKRAEGAKLTEDESVEKTEIEDAKIESE